MPQCLKLSSNQAVRSRAATVHSTALQQHTEGKLRATQTQRTGCWSVVTRYRSVTWVKSTGQIAAHGQHAVASQQQHRQHLVMMPQPHHSSRRNSTPSSPPAAPIKFTVKSHWLQGQRQFLFSFHTTHKYGIRAEFSQAQCRTQVNEVQVDLFH